MKKFIEEMGAALWRFFESIARLTGTTAHTVVFLYILVLFFTFLIMWAVS